MRMKAPGAGNTLCVLCLCAGTAWGAPITFNTALPVHEDGWVVREQYIFMKVGDDPSAANRDMEVSGAVSVVGYGVSRDLALFAMLPYFFNKSLDMTMGGQNLHFSSQGVGDLTALARYTLYEQNAPGQTLRVAPFVGVKAPTGRNNITDGMGRLPAPVQPGSGSWDWLGGAVATYQMLDFQSDGQVSYKLNREANGFQAGNVAELDGSLQYRLWPRSLGRGVPGFLYGVVDVNLIHAAKDRAGGQADSNSGGTTLLLAPGLQYVTRKWIVEAGAQLPVVQDLNGMALKSNYGVNAGFRVNF